MVTPIAPKTTTPRYIRPQDFIRETGLPERTVYKWLEDGILEGFQIGRAWYLPETEITEVFDRARQAAA